MRERRAKKRCTRELSTVPTRKSGADFTQRRAGSVQSDDRRPALQRSQGVRGLSRLTLKELMQIKGISQVRGLEILAFFELARRISEEQTREIDVVANPDALMAWLGREIGGKAAGTLFSDLSRRKLHFRTPAVVQRDAGCQHRPSPRGV